MDEYVAPVCHLTGEAFDPKADIPKDEPPGSVQSAAPCALLFDDGSSTKTSRRTKCALALGTVDVLSVLHNPTLKTEGSLVTPKGPVTLHHHGLGYAVHRIAHVGISPPDTVILLLYLKKAVRIRSGRKAVRLCTRESEPEKDRYITGPHDSTGTPLSGAWVLAKHQNHVVLRGVITGRNVHAFKFTSEHCNKILSFVETHAMCPCKKKALPEDSVGASKSSASRDNSSADSAKTKQKPESLSRSVPLGNEHRHMSRPRPVSEEGSDTDAHSKSASAGTLDDRLTHWREQEEAENALKYPRKGDKNAAYVPQNRADTSRSGEANACGETRQKPTTNIPRNYEKERVPCASDLESQPRPTSSLQRFAETVENTLAAPTGAGYAVIGIAVGVGTLLTLSHWNEDSPAFVPGRTPNAVSGNYPSPVVVNIYNHKKESRRF